MAVIYRITNMLTGDYYIGGADSFARREWQHRYALKNGNHKNPRLQAAWTAYGEGAFVFEVLEEVLPEAQLRVEDMWLGQHVGRRDCYNVNMCAEASRLGTTLSQQSREKISASRKGKHAGEAHYRYGQTLSEEVRRKIGDAQRGKPKGVGRKVSPEGLAKIRNNIAAGRSHKHWTGRKHTAEAKMKMSKPVRVTDPDGVQAVYPSLTAVLEATGLLMPTLRRALVSGEPLKKGQRKGYRFEYVALDKTIV